MRATPGQIGPSRLVSFVIAGLLAFKVSMTLAQTNNVDVSIDRKWSYDEITKAPEKARVRRNPFENDSDAVLAGGKLFERNCAGCHGRKGEGSKRAPSLLRQEAQQATPGALFWVLTNGVVWRGMPVWSKLPEPERWQIVTFLKTLKISAVPSETGGG